MGLIDPANIQRIRAAGIALFRTLTYRHVTVEKKLDAIYDQCDPDVLGVTIERFRDSIGGSEDHRLGKIFLPTLHAHQVTLWFVSGD
jgi:hypothetical protein